MSTLSAPSKPVSWPVRILLKPADVLLGFIGPRYTLYFWFYKKTPASWIEFLSRLRTIRAIDHAKRRVPAYAAFLNSSGSSIRLPETDKVNYVTEFSPEERCLDGVLPTKDVAIDESSGSTGTPFNWIRSLAEREVSHFFISHFARYAYGDEPWITINAFSMGAWATGVNMGTALQKRSVVKSTGPDLDKILKTLDYFGPKHRYLICGYPPFLKHIIDGARDQGFPLEKFRLMALLGGEGNSEGLRDYLYQRFDPIYSGYGATDVEIGIAGETPMSLAIRREARDNPALKQSVFGDDARLPMVFQYSPLMHHVEVNEQDELIFTITRLNVLTPRIRYNIPDSGGVATFAEMREQIEATGHDFNSLVEASGVDAVPMPFFWVFGRKDSTVSVMGANVYPEDIEECLYTNRELASITNSYCISLEDFGAESRLVCSFELRSGNLEELQGAYETSIVESLVHLNADFREAIKEFPDAARPIVRLYEMGDGPFDLDSGKIKQTRIITLARGS